MMYLLVLLVGILIGYNLSEYDNRHSPSAAGRVQIKVGTISEKEKK